MKHLLAVFLISISCFLFACGGDSATEHFDRGEDYRNHGQYELAIEAYKKAIAINPNYAKAYNGLGFIYTSADPYEPDLAFEFYKKAIALNPNYADVYKNLGWLYRKRRRYDLAIESYKKAIAINPNDAEALSRLASSYRMEGNFDLAFEFYYKAIATNPNLALAHYCLACVHSLKNNKDLAVESLQKAISLDRKSIELAKTDRDFDNVRESPEFQQLINSVE